jgi:hypothetical protein
MVEIIKAPNPINKDNIYKSKKIFLAGSIEMGTAENWQKVAEDFFAEYDQHITIFNPRRDDWDSSWTQEFENPQFYQQVNWELTALDAADIIVVYFSPETKSPISLLELGLYAHTGKLKVCCPKGFWRKGNVDIVCEKYGIPNSENFKKLLYSCL